MPWYASLYLIIKLSRVLTDICHVGTLCDRRRNYLRLLTTTLGWAGGVCGMPGLAILAWCKFQVSLPHTLTQFSFSCCT